MLVQQAGSWTRVRACTRPAEEALRRGTWRVWLRMGLVGGAYQEMAPCLSDVPPSGARALLADSRAPQLRVVRQ